MYRRFSIILKTILVMHKLKSFISTALLVVLLSINLLSINLRQSVFVILGNILTTLDDIKQLLFEISGDSSIWYNSMKFLILCNKLKFWETFWKNYTLLKYYFKLVLDVFCFFKRWYSLSPGSFQSLHIPFYSVLLRNCRFSFGHEYTIVLHFELMWHNSFRFKKLLVFFLKSFYVFLE